MKKMTQFFVLGVMLTAGSSLFAQVEISEDTQKAEKKKEKKRKIMESNESGNATDVFVITNWSSTSRTLQENSNSLYADTLGARADETSLNTWSFGLGFRSQINKSLTWEGGLSLLRNGESYTLENSDTTYKYQTTYTYIAMPLKVYYTYGDDIRFFAGGGLVPQMFIGYKQDREWKDALNATGEETFKTKSGYNSFVLSAVANVGVQVNFGKRISLLVMPEYRIQFTNSYDKFDSYEHFGRAFGVSMGLTYRL